ncbi:MAG: LysR substrate-binding domain-containing protein [Luteibacter sp.]
MELSTAPTRPNFTGLSFRDLEYVVAVADLGSFIRAAQHCHVAQPSLSVQVRRIEERLNTVIFERSPRGVVLTPSGRAVVEQMRRALAEGRALLALAQRSDIPFNGALRLSAVPTIAPYLFPRVLPALRMVFPAVELLLGEATGSDLVAAVVTGDIDAAIVTAPVGQRAVESVSLLREELLMACPAGHPAARDDGPDWHDLPASDRLFLGERDCLREHAARAAGAPADGRPSLTLEALMYRVAAGEGCALVPAFAARETPGVVHRASSRRDRRREWLLVYRTRTPDAAAIADLARCLSAATP